MRRIALMPFSLWKKLLNARSTSPDILWDWRMQHTTEQQTTRQKGAFPGMLMNEAGLAIVFHCRTCESRERNASTD